MKNHNIVARQKFKSNIYESIMTKVGAEVKKALSEGVLMPVDRNDYVKSWYVKKYPTDELGRWLNPSLTFSLLWKYMRMGVNCYVMFAVDSSLVRERIFEELSSRLNVDYDVVYRTWLHKQVELTDDDYIRVG